MRATKRNLLASETTTFRRIVAAVLQMSSVWCVFVQWKYMSQYCSPSLYLPTLYICFGLDSVHWLRSSLSLSLFLSLSFRLSLSPSRAIRWVCCSFQFLCLLLLRCAFISQVVRVFFLFLLFESTLLFQVLSSGYFFSWNCYLFLVCFILAFSYSIRVHPL